MTGVKPWAVGPFEMLYHAEIHFLKGEDFDRRIALISFDNAIEVAITTYLALHPIQRKNATYKKDDVEKWQKNYHTKLDFFYQEVSTRSLTELVEKADIIFADPPFDLVNIKEIPKIIIEKKMINEGGCFILEHAAGLSFDEFEEYSYTKNYGSVHFSFFFVD